MKIILSCTTTSERAEIFYYTFQSLLRQELQPDLFLVNLSKESYLSDGGFSEVPEWLRDDRVTVNWTKNTGSYRKFLPALDYAGEDDIIITADDDILYDRRWLKNLSQIAEKQSERIVSVRARKMKKSFRGKWKNYGQWHLITESTTGYDILPNGGAGAVFRKKLLDLDFLTDHAFLSIAPTTDDLWFRMASLLKGTQVKVFPKLQLNNRFIEHDKGLIHRNSPKVTDKFLLSRGLKKMLNSSLDILNINRTVNDEAWSCIVDYACAEYSYKEQF